MRSLLRFIAGIAGCIFAATQSSGCAASSVSPLAARTDTPDYVGRYIGGGTHFGQVRQWDEGTWARDYCGFDPLHLLELRWSHSQQNRQGGVGSY